MDFFFNISCFLHILCYFQHLKQNWCRNKIRGGGCRNFLIFLEKHFFIIKFRVLCYFQHYIFFGNIEKCPFTYWLNGRWFLQIVDRDSGNPIFLISNMSNVGVVAGGGGGGIFFLHVMLFPTFLEKINSGNKKPKKKLFTKTIQNSR